MGQRHSVPKIVHVQHEVVKSSVERTVRLRALPLEKYRERVIDLKVDLCGLRRHWPDPIDGSVKVPEAALSLQASFEGHVLNNDVYLKNLCTSRERPIHICTFQHHPVRSRQHDTHIYALPSEILVGHIMALLTKQDRLAFACSNRHVDDLYKASPLCDMSKNKSLLDGNETLIDAMRTGQSLRIVRHLLSTRTDLTPVGIRTSLLIALCNGREPGIIQALLDPTSGEDIVDMKQGYMLSVVRGHLPRDLQHAQVKLREVVRLLARKPESQHLLRNFLSTQAPQ